MAWQQYQVETSKKPVVRVNGTSIVITNEAWAATRLAGSNTVILLWDDERSLIGIKATESPDKSKFTVRESRNGHTINARKFFDRFKLTGLSVAASAQLGEDAGLITIPISLPRRAAASANGAEPKRRGRPKSLTAAA